MVWSTTQSALYSDLSRYYEDEKRKPNPQETEPQKFEQKIREKTSENQAENKLEKSCGSGCDILRENSCNSPVKSGADTHNHSNCPNCQFRQHGTQNPLAQLFSDKDMLLIAGLIFLLIKQGADKKLILALAFVLLS